MSDKERAYELINEGKYEEAFSIINSLLNESEINNADNRDELYYLLGNIELSNKNFALAKALFEKALSLNPNSACINNNLGVSHKNLGYVVESRKYFEEAIRLVSVNAAANKAEWQRSMSMYVSNYASVYAAHGEPEKSISINKTALDIVAAYNKNILESNLTEEEKKKKLSRTNMRALWNIAIASLEMGNYEQGFRLYDHGFDIELGLLKLRHYPKIPLWRGEKCKTLLIYGDQGLGDEIMYASILPDIIKTHNVILECHPRLISLFKRAFPGVPAYPTRKDEIGADWTQEHEIDAAVSMCLIPKYYRTKKEDFPGKPYLFADKDGDADVNARLKTLNRRLKVGISWAGGTVDTGKKYRNISLNELKPLLDMDCVDFISLQYTKETQESVEKFKKETGITIHHWQEVVDDYDKTACLLMNLDLVISVPQSVIHLSGALGVRTLQLCPKYSMWQCGRYGEDAPWYKSVVNIWQSTPYEWTNVIKEAKDILENVNLEKIRNLVEHSIISSCGVEGIKVDFEKEASNEPNINSEESS